MNIYLKAFDLSF